MDSKLNELTYDVCEEFHQSPPLVFAIIKACSHWNPYISVYNPIYSKVNLQKKPSDIHEETEIIHQRTRWGLMMLQGYEVRNLGFKGYLSRLMFPDENISWGVKHFADLSVTCDGVELLASFNQKAPDTKLFIERVLRYEVEYNESMSKGEIPGVAYADENTAD